MNKEIKFRGIATNPFDGWVYGSLLKLTDTVTEEKKYYICYETGEKISVRPETVGQLTGLEDSCGNDNYKGDILEWEDNKKAYRGFVFWSDDANGWRIQMPKGYMPSFKLLGRHTKIIGNIYQNLELLESVQK